MATGRRRSSSAHRACGADTRRKTGRTRAALPPQDETETFNLDQVSSSSDDDQPDRPAPPVLPTIRNDDTDSAAPPYDPLLDTARSESQTSSTYDVDHYFEREKDKPSVCRVCSNLRDKYPAEYAKQKKHTISYSPNTTTGVLRGHIGKWHLLHFINLAMEPGRAWPIQVSPVKEILALGYTLEELKAFLEKGVDLKSLPPRAMGDSLPDPAASSDRANVPPFSLPIFRKFLVNFIIADDQSLNVVECKEFRRLILLLRDDLKDSNIPHRTKIRSDIIQAWKDYFAILKIDLASAVGDVSFTADIWSSDSRRPYLAVTAHWITEISQSQSLQPRSALLAFHRIRGKHTGSSLARTILYLLDRAGVTAKAGHFTMDNAENNVTMMTHLSQLLVPRELPLGFDAKDRRIMCYAHIMNICVQHVVEAFRSPDMLAEAWDDAFDDDEVDKDEYLAAVQRDPVSLGRSVVRAIRASGLRRDEFEKLVATGNDQDWFKSPDGQPVQVPETQLLHDVRTRWDSTFYMINRLRTLHLPIDCFLSLPGQKDIAHYRMSDMDWFVLREYEILLDIPHKVQQRMSAEKRATLNRAVPSFELFMTAWEKLRETNKRIAPFIDVGLKWAKQYYNRMDNTQAYIISMLVDPSLRFRWIRKYWGQEWITRAENIVLALMEKYRATKVSASGNVESSPQPDSLDSLARLYGLDDMELGPSRRGALQAVEKEYRMYVDGELVDGSMDPLRFWEVNRTRFPTIFAIAMDYLPIQASSVPCERVFSSSADTDTKKRNLISPILMEALQMLKYHLRSQRIDFLANWTSPYAVLVEDEPEEPDDAGNKWKGDANVHATLQALLDRSEAEEGEALPSNVIIYA